MSFMMTYPWRGPDARLSRIKKVGSRSGMKFWMFSDGLIFASRSDIASIDVSVIDLYSIANFQWFVNRFKFVG